MITANTHSATGMVSTSFRVTSFLVSSPIARISAVSPVIDISMWPPPSCLVLVCSLVSTSSRPCTSRGEPACKRLLLTGCCLQHRRQTTNGYRKRRPCLLRQFGLFQQ